MYQDNNSKIEKKIKVLVYILLFTFSYHLKAELGPDQIIDSLKKELFKDIPSKEKLKLNYGISERTKRLLPDTSIKYSDDGLTESIKTKDDLYRTRFTRLKGEALRNLGRSSESEINLNKALEISKKMSLKEEEGLIHKILAFIFGEKNEIEKAKEHLDEAASIFKELKMFNEYNQTKAILAEMQVLDGEVENVEEFLSKEKEIIAELKSNDEKIDFFQKIGRVRGRKGQWQEAFENFQKVQTLAEKKRDQSSWFENIAEQAEFLFEMDKKEEAASRIAEMKVKAKKIQSKTLDDFVKGVNKRLKGLDLDDKLDDLIDKKEKIIENEPKKVVSSKTDQLEEEPSYKAFYILLSTVLLISLIMTLYYLKEIGKIKFERRKKTSVEIDNSKLVEVLKEDLDFFSDEDIIDMLEEINYSNIRPIELEKVREMSRIQRKRYRSDARINNLNKVLVYVKEKESKKRIYNLDIHIKEQVEGFFEVASISKILIELLTLSPKGTYEISGARKGENLEIKLTGLPDSISKLGSSISLVYIDYLVKLNKGEIFYVKSKGKLNAIIVLSAAFSEL